MTSDVSDTCSSAFVGTHFMNWEIVYQFDNVGIKPPDRVTGTRNQREDWFCCRSVDSNCRPDSVSR
jgi:hypothetical protein